MGLFDRFISIERTQEMPTPSEGAPVSRHAKIVAPGVTAISPLVITSAGTTATLDPQLVQNLEAKVAENTPAEYAQFRAFFDSLAALPENIRYSTAINVAKAAKLSPDAILKAMDTRIKNFLIEKEGFDNWIATETKTFIDDNHTKIAQTQQQILELSKQIEALTAENQSRSLVIQEEQTRISTNAQKFSMAHDNVLQRLNAERSAFATALTPNTP